jgi:hypothetical protein
MQRMSTFVHNGIGKPTGVSHYATGENLAYPLQAPLGSRAWMSLTNVSKRIWTLCLKRYVPRYQTVAITKAASTLPSNSFNVHGVAEQRWAS